MFCSTTFGDVVFGSMFSPENRFDISSCKGGKPAIGLTILGGIMLVPTLIFWELNIVGCYRSRNSWWYHACSNPDILGTQYRRRWSCRTCNIQDKARVYSMITTGKFTCSGTTGVQ